jgi:hypothetical protein
MKSEYNNNCSKGKEKTSPKEQKITDLILDIQVEI